MALGDVQKPGTIRWITNSGELATAKRYLAKRTDERFRVAAMEHGNDLVRACIALSQGTMSLAEMARQHHPYSKKFPSNHIAPAHPDWIVNIQTGRFAASWHWHLYKATSSWIILVWNDAPEAKYLEGTTKMRERPIMKQARKLVDKRRIAAFQAVVQRAIVENNVSMAPLPSFGTEIKSIARIEGSAFERALGFGSGSAGAFASGSAGSADEAVGGALMHPLLFATIQGSSSVILALINSLK
jgi:hypothetical protein